MRTALICLILASAFSVSALGATAQGSLPETVSPDLCTIEPLTELDLVLIVEAATPTPETAINSDQNGSPVDDSTAQEITDLVRLSVACVNANDPMRSFTLLSDGFLQFRFGGDNEDDLGHLLAAITRTPGVAQAGDRLTLESVADIRELAGGQVIATVTTSNAENVFVDTLIFAQITGEWKIDGVMLGEPQSWGTPGN